MAQNQGASGGVFGSTFQTDSSGIAQDLCLDVFTCSSLGGKRTEQDIGGGGNVDSFFKMSKETKDFIDWISGRVKGAISERQQPENEINKFGKIRAINDGIVQTEFKNIVEINNTYQITKGSKLRSSPSVKTQSNVLYTYEKGGSTFTAKEKGESDGAFWYLGVDENGYNGFIKEDAVKIIQGKEPEMPKIDLNNLQENKDTGKNKGSKPFLTENQKMIIYPAAAGIIVLGIFYLFLRKN